jgi:hypothetical protein
VIESFITTMQGVYHPRLDYPKEKVQPKSEIPEFEEVLLAPKTSISKNKRTM